MPNPPKKIISNANDSDSFNELKHRQNYCHVRTGAFTYAMVHLVSRATFFFFLSITAPILQYRPFKAPCTEVKARKTCIYFWTIRSSFNLCACEYSGTIRYAR